MSWSVLTSPGASYVHVDSTDEVHKAKYSIVAVFHSPAWSELQTTKDSKGRRPGNVASMLLRVAKLHEPSHIIIPWAFQQSWGGCQWGPPQREICLQSSHLPTSANIHTYMYSTYTQYNKLGNMRNTCISSEFVNITCIYVHNEHVSWGGLILRKAGQGLGMRLKLRHTQSNLQAFPPSDFMRVISS